MNWSLARRLLIVAFLALDGLLFGLLRTNGPSLALPGLPQPPAVKASSVSDPLPPGDQQLKELRLSPAPMSGVVAAARADGGTGSPSLLRAVKQKDGTWVLTLSLGGVAPAAGPKAALTEAESILGRLPLPNLLETGVTASAKGGFTATFEETVNRVPLLGSLAEVALDGHGGATVSLRLFRAAPVGTPEAVLPAAQAVGFYIASGGSSDVRSVSLDYPASLLGGKATQVAPEWTISTPAGDREVNAYTGQVAP